MRGRASAEDICEYLAENSEVPADIWLSELEVSCRSMQLIDPSILTLIASHRKRGTKVGIATDNMDTFTRWTVPQLDLENDFDFILDSSTLAMLKSDTDAAGRGAFFRRYSDTLPDIKRSLLIDDSYDAKLLKRKDFDVITVRPGAKDATTMLKQLLP